MGILHQNFNERLDKAETFIKQGKLGTAEIIILKHLEEELGATSQIIWFIKQQKKYDKSLKKAAKYCRRGKKEDALTEIQSAGDACFQMIESLKILNIQLQREL